MAFTFQILPVRGQSPSQGINTVFLLPNDWDDYNYKTIFGLIIFDEQGNKFDLGSVKIGYSEQPSGWTKEHLPLQFQTLPETFFSLGQDADYYAKLVDNFSEEIVTSFLTALGDIASMPIRFELAKDEGVFHNSFLRTVNQTSIEHQFRRILSHQTPLTDFNFIYKKESNPRYAGFQLEFTIEPGSKPASNIHILIGRNGVGKTTLLNNMVDALLPDRGTVEETGSFLTPASWGDPSSLDDDYFAGIVSVSFSAFDPFSPPENQSDPSQGLRYCYIGLKKRLSQSGQTIWGLKTKDELESDFTNSAKLCFALTGKRNRWDNAIAKLESDSNFAEMNLIQLINSYDEDTSTDKHLFSEKAHSLFKRMSSGHAIVLLTITKLVETVEEKTLVLIDEPESHLHPPLLSAFTRALSDLLVNRNALAIIATHSPVVLQEVPKSCVSILRRTRLTANIDRLEKETFAENVGVLTREVFDLEVSKSGFYDLLKKEVSDGLSYDEIIERYQDQLGLEGKLLLKSMVTTRDLDLGNSE